MKNNPLEFLSLSKETSQDPIKTVHGIKIDLRRIKDERYVVLKLCKIISNPDRPTDAYSLQWRICILRYLENYLRTIFSSSRDFKRKTESYLNGYEVRKKPIGDRIRRARKKKRWSQQELAQHLGYQSHVAVVLFERGLRYPPAKVFRWLEEHECNKK